MARFAFRLRIRAESMENYDAEHRHVWPELLRVLKGAGLARYSIFRGGQDLFFYMEAEDFERSWAEIEMNGVNQLWQSKMAALFEPMHEPRSGERFPMLEEVFYLE